MILKLDVSMKKRGLCLLCNFSHLLLLLFHFREITQENAFHGTPIKVWALLESFQQYAQHTVTFPSSYLELSYHHASVCVCVLSPCADPLQVNWLLDGCETLEHGGQRTECRCNHLTYFSILVVRQAWDVLPFFLMMKQETWFPEMALFPSHNSNWRIGRFTTSWHWRSLRLWAALCLWSAASPSSSTSTGRGSTTHFDFLVGHVNLMSI